MDVLGPFPPESLREVAHLEGNDKCCDCFALECDWASVSYGIVLCLECAGRHRRLGVQVSFIRSLHMDTWTRSQVEHMRQGGNARLQHFFHKMNVEQSPIEVRYASQMAAMYREGLRMRVEQVLAGIVSSDLPTPRYKSSPRNSDRSISREDVRESNHVQREVIFGHGAMGMTLTKNYKQGAFVSRLVSGGEAEKRGVCVGDVVVGVAGKRMVLYEEIMHMIPFMSRPLPILFERVASTKVSEEAANVSKEREIGTNESPSKPPHKIKTVARVRGAKKSQSESTNSDDELPNKRSPSRYAIRKRRHSKAPN